ncbi:hypothetical protein DVH05_026148 [Phytophthora capsici]|nr:hypothetical protein DVH05_026148 [Phytophthora capsici]
MLSECSSDRYTDAQSKKFLDSFSIKQGTEYVWFGIIVDEEDNVYVEVGTPGTTDAVQPKVHGGGLPFTPSNLCIKDLEYFVTLPSGEEKQLLRGITAHFEPGRMVALMGATGAGKTTLTDVIAGRKTGGRIVGDITANGEPKNRPTSAVSRRTVSRWTSTRKPLRSTRRWCSQPTCVYRRRSRRSSA